MKIEVPKENLLNALSLAEKVSGKNLTLPVLNCILLEAKNNILKIRSTNLDLGIEITVPSKITEEGIVTVSGSIFHSVVSNIYENNTILLENEKNNLVIKTPKSKTVIKTVPHEDFPTLPGVEGSKTFSLSSSEFLKGIKTVWYSASISTIKPELSSIYIYTYNGKIFFVATDSFRLAEKQIIQKKVNNFDPFLIPFKNIPEIIKVFEQYDGEIDFFLNGNQISFVIDNIYLTSRLVDGTFPDYKQIIPKTFETDVIVLKQDLINIFKKINIFSDKFNQLNFSILPSKKTFFLEAKNNDVGETKDTISAAITGKDLNINFNHKYISDCFQSINNDSVSFSFSGLSKPVVIKGVSDESFFYLVMPMNK